MLYRILYSDELAHHGVQGQQWGIQNGPPYPLDRSISTGSRLKTTEEKSRKQQKISKQISQNNSYKSSEFYNDVKKQIDKDDVEKLRREFSEALNAEGDIERWMDDHYNDTLMPLFNKYKTEELYNIPNNAMPKELVSLYKKLDKTADTFDRHSKRIVDEMVGPYGDIKVSNLPSYYSDKSVKHHANNLLKNALAYEKIREGQPSAKKLLRNY